MPTDRRGVSRRGVLRAAGGTAALSFAGVAGASDDGEGDHPACPDGSGESHRGCRGATMAGCADDHPRTRELQAAVQQSLRERYTDVGTLLDEGYLPYFDVGRPGEAGGYSHWLNPEFVGDGTLLDPDRPESVLVDNEWWRPIGMMFVATDEGERIDAPPAVYGRDGGDDTGEESGDEAVCSPWHAHDDLPARFAWWFYRTVYEDDPVDADLRLSVDEDGVDLSGDLDLPCLTACMMHVWAYPNPEGVYAHGPPPRGQRGGPPAEKPGFDTDATPGEDDLGWGVLPDAVVEQAKPDWEFGGDGIGRGGGGGDGGGDGVLDWLD